MYILQMGVIWLGGVGVSGFGRGLKIEIYVGVCDGMCKRVGVWVG